MGCFNLKGFLSRVTISCGDEVVMMLGINKDSGTKIFYTLEKIVPISLPVYGKYNDYGGIDHIKEDNNTKWLEKNIGKLEDIIEAFGECGYSYCKTIKNCKNSENDYHPETNVRYIYDNLLKLGLREKDELCLLFEHKKVYEEWAIKDFAKQQDDDNFSIDKLLDYGSFTLRGFHGTYHFGNQSHRILSLYDREFLKRNIKEVNKLQDFIWSMISMGMSIQIPMQYSQEDNFDSDIEYHNNCINLIEDLKKAHDWDDDWEESEDKLSERQQKARTEILTLVLEDLNGYETAKETAKEYQGDFEDKLIKIIKKYVK